MGSYRSAPDIAKHTYEMFSLDHSYAITHMCGNLFSIKDGVDTCRMPV